MDYHLKKPCSECPFRREAPAGWLGPWTVFEILQVIGRSAFACHRTVTESFNEDQPGLESCAGMAIFLNNNLEVSRNESNRRHQDLLKRSPHAKTVFSNRGEFAAHHQPPTRKESKNERANRSARRHHTG